MPCHDVLAHVGGVGYQRGPCKNDYMPRIDMLGGVVGARYQRAPQAPTTCLCLSLICKGV